ncbi:MAG: glycosyltransferase family 4 protein [Rubrobacter sp.]|nr:glycosyltransferase family 4 protein [Rubrobacter sp.]
MVRILHVPPGFYPRVGGEENHVLGWARQQVDLGNEVVVVAPEEGTPEVREIDGILIRRVKTLMRFATADITPSLPFRLLREPADVFHAHYPMPWNADWGVLVGRLRRKPVVLTYTSDLGGRGLKGLFGMLYNHTLLRLTLRLSHRIVVSSPHYPRLSAHLRRHQHKTVVIPPGVDTEHFRPIGTTREAHTVLFVGTLQEHHRYKGLESLLRAVKIARERVPELRLVVAGEGPKNNIFSRLAAELGIERHVHFLGFVPHKELRTWYNRCAVFAMPSLSWHPGGFGIVSQESFGMVALEAMACGAPTIVSHVVGMIEDIREYDAAAVVEPGNHQEIADILLYLLGNEARRRELGRNSRRLAEERYTWERVTAKTLSLYRELIEKHTGRKKP